MPTSTNLPVIVDPVPVVNQPKIPIPRGTVAVPPVAYPTIALAIGALAMYGITHWLYHEEIIGYPAAVLMWTVSAYVSFTPMHDASHSAIATNKSGMRWLNSVVGHLCSIPLSAPFDAFRHLHLEHHKYTNIAGYDPDVWSSRLSTNHLLLLPQHWWSQLHSYIFHYLRDAFVRHKRPSFEIPQVIVSCAVMFVYPYISLCLYGFSSFAFWCYYLPGSLAVACLAFVLDYIPHRPHGTTDVYKSTLIVSASSNHPTKGVTNGGNDSSDAHRGDSISPLTLLMLFQNYHAVHHLYPWVPFYQYSKVWYAMENQLRDKGVKVRPFFPLFEDRSNL